MYYINIKLKGIFNLKEGVIMEKTLEKKDGATRCRFCVSFVKESSYCTTKKTTVAANKKRHCVSYLLDSSKVDIQELVTRKSLPTVRGVIERGLRRELITKQNAAERVMRKEQALEMVRAAEEKFPLTGDLSRFKTTADVEKPPVEES